MYLFAAEIPSASDGHKTAHALLGWAVQRVRGVPCPEIRRSESGKPYFDGDSGLHFSLSHTKTHVLLALSEHDVGVDIETRREVPERLRNRLFTVQEQREFDFFEGWTLREAVFKLTGAGGLMTMRLTRNDGGIVTPFPGVRCRSYNDIPGCAAAVACREGNLPGKIELVPADVFLS